jgi:tetratricopeptide (TPR) repeat protein
VKRQLRGPWVLILAGVKNPAALLQPQLCCRGSAKEEAQRDHSSRRDLLSRFWQGWNLPPSLSPACWGAAWLFPVILSALVAFPHLASAYHLEAGGRQLGALELVAYNPLPALAHLQKAIEWAPDNAQAYRLLARVYQAQGDLAAAIEAQRRYTELRPHNPLGYLELAELYEAVEAEMAAMEIADLIAALPEATVQTPDVPLDTPFAQSDGPAWHSYVAPTTFSLPPGFGDRPTLFMHPPSWVTYTLFLPPQPAILRFGLGMDPQSHGWSGDGATFEVFLNGERVFLEHLDKGVAREGWHERTVDLSPWAGEELALALAVTPGPAADPSGDWAGWGEPQMVEARLPALEAQDFSGRLVEAWRRAGLTAEAFIARGEEARQAERYDEALAWYERAARLEPGLGDPWYYVGLLREDQQQWMQALEAYERALAIGRFQQVGRSSPHYRTGVIYQWRLEPGQTDTALAAYEAAIEAGDFSADWEAADCHYKRGEVLRRQKADVDEYMAEFRQAVELNPRHTWAHILLGLAIYERDKDAVMAEAELQQALELAPQNKWAYYHLGEIYRQEGRTDKAAAMYEQALEIDPDLEAAQKRLSALRGEK